MKKQDIGLGCVLIAICVLIGLFGFIIFNFFLCKPKIERFQKIVDNEGVFIFVDKETQVMYVSHGGFMTVMVDSNGKPLLYLGDKDEK